MLQSRRAYVAQHCGGNKHVRERVPDEPGLMRNSHLVRERSTLFNGFTISKTIRLMPSINSLLRYDCCDETCSV